MQKVHSTQKPGTSTAPVLPSYRKCPFLDTHNILDEISENLQEIQAAGVVSSWSCWGRECFLL